MYIRIYALYALLKAQLQPVCMKHTTQESAILVMTLLSYVYIRICVYIIYTYIHTQTYINVIQYIY